MPESPAVIVIDWVNGQPDAETKTIKTKGNVPVIWIANPTSGITSFTIADLNEEVFRDLRPNGPLQWIANDINTPPNAGTYDYTIVATHETQPPRSHDPQVINEPE